MILKQLFESRIAQLHCLLGIQNHDGQRAIFDQSIEIGGALFDSFFEIVMRFLNGEIALLDAVEHAVELIEQDSDFVLVSFERANGIVFVRGDRRSGLRQFANGL